MTRDHAGGDGLCSACGERDPYPRWFCLFRAAGVAKQGEPCSYSLDGADRAERARSALKAEGGE